MATEIVTTYEQGERAAWITLDSPTHPGIATPLRTLGAGAGQHLATAIDDPSVRAVVLTCTHRRSSGARERE